VRNAYTLRSLTVHSQVPWAQSPKKAKGILLPFRLIETFALCLDVAIILVMSVLTGISYSFLAFDRTGSIEDFLIIGALTCVNFCAILSARRDYEPQNLADFMKQLRETTGVWLVVFLMLTGIAFSLKVGHHFSRGATLSFFATSYVAIIVSRLIVARSVASALKTGAFAEQKVILFAEKGELADGANIDELVRRGYRPVRTFEFSSRSHSQGLPLRLSRSIKEIVKISRSEKIDCIFLLIPWDDRISIEYLTEALRVLSIPVYLLPDRNVSHFLGGRLTNIGSTWTAELKRSPLTATERTCKRAVDLIIAPLLLAMLAPVMILAAILIKLDSRGPVLFMQTRNGFSGHLFRMCKFRTMDVLEDGAAISQAKKDDPRITRVGRFLRRTNIDELPQLFNVLAGDMSLVGPRPHAKAHNSKYERIIAKYAYRYHVKPGLTGWAQVHGLRGETQTVDLMESRIEYDLWYINNWSLLLDFNILLRTLVLGIQPTAY
jgi:Undecaprenyl-phosphate glucose phosphotransferase